MIKPKPIRYIKTVKNKVARMGPLLNRIGIIGQPLFGATFIFAIFFSAISAWAEVQQSGSVFGSPGLLSQTSAYKPSWEFYNLTKYFSTNANYTSSGGEFEKLSDGKSLTALFSDFGAVYALSSKYKIRGGLQYARIESKGATETRRNSGLSRFDLALVYESKFGALLIRPEISVSIPASRVDLASDNLPLGESAQEIQPLMYIQVPTQSLSPHAFLGYRYRDEGRAHLIPYGLGVEFQLQKYSQIGWELSGYTFAKKDLDSDTPTSRQDYTNRVQAGSLAFAAINPRAIQSELYYRYRSGRNFGFYGAYGWTLNGAASAAGSTFTFGISYAFGSSDKSSGRNEESNPRNFKYDTPELEYEDPNPQPKKGPRKNIKQQMDDAEKYLEDNARYIPDDEDLDRYPELEEDYQENDPDGGGIFW